MNVCCLHVLQTSQFGGNSSLQYFSLKRMHVIYTVYIETSVNVHSTFDNWDCFFYRYSWDIGKCQCLGWLEVSLTNLDGNEYVVLSWIPWTDESLFVPVEIPGSCWRVGAKGHGLVAVLIMGVVIPLVSTSIGELPLPETKKLKLITYAIQKTSFTSTWYFTSCLLN